MPAMGDSLEFPGGPSSTDLTNKERSVPVRLDERGRDDCLLVNDAIHKAATCFGTADRRGKMTSSTFRDEALQNHRR
jgi:hypothetical protein